MSTDAYWPRSDDLSSNSDLIYMAIVKSGRPRFQWDHRFPGDPQFVLATDADLMKIPDEMLRCVAFIGCTTKGGHRTEFGTAFIVGYVVDVSSSDRFAITYVVTARHIIDSIRDATIDGHCHLRLNWAPKGEGVPANMEGVITAKMDVGVWKSVDDNRVDVAISEFPIQLEEYHHNPLLNRTFVTDVLVTSLGIGPGEELCFPGMFTPHKGTRQTIPILRMGSIAAMPHERIETAFGNIQGYLIEARSISGLSGSPVFVMRENDDKTYRRFYLLGLIHGHYNVRDHLDAADAIAFPTLTALNRGIAIVVPATDIASTLELPVFVNARERIKAEYIAEKAKSLPTPD